MVDAQDSAVARFKFIVVAFIFKLLLREDRNIEREGLVRIFISTGCSKTHFPPLDVYVITVVVTAIFLRTDVIFMHGCSGSLKTAMACSVLPMPARLPQRRIPRSILIPVKPSGFPQESASEDPVSGELSEFRNLS